jgi:hypothetical protein
MLLALILVPAALAAQPFRAETPRQAPAAAPAAKGAFAVEPNYDPQRQRCQNFARELRSIRRQQHEASITGAQDAAAQRRMEVEAQARQAGCRT